MRRSVIMLIGIVILAIAATSFAVDCGDVNNDGFVNILDIVHLINYKYKAGPEPNCGTDIGTVTDIDGNVYYTVKICDQWWMMENLKVTHYRNGDAIPNVTGNTWYYLTTGAYCEYNNDVNNVVTYGRLYNWYAVNDSRNIAPDGWHVATDDEWKQMETCLGMSQVDADATGWRGNDEGGKLKESGTTHWLMPNAGATNESGFSALPGGFRFPSPADYFDYMYESALFWSSTEGNSGNSWGRNLSCNISKIYRYSYDKRNGFSVRCVRD